VSHRLRAVALLAIVLSPAAVTRAAAQVPAAPAEGARITGTETVLRWTLADGLHTRCLEWAARPETASDGGRFLEPSGSTCDLAATDVAYLLEDLAVGRYYWHVAVERERCDPADCRTEDTYGPTASFDVVPPPLPRGCTPAAAKVRRPVPEQAHASPAAGRRLLSHRRQRTPGRRPPPAAYFALGAARQVVPAPTSAAAAWAMAARASAPTPTIVS